MSDSFATPWTIAHQAPLSIGFPRQEYWSGLPFPSPRGRQILYCWATREDPQKAESSSQNFPLLSQEQSICESGSSSTLLGKILRKSSESPEREQEKSLREGEVDLLLASVPTSIKKSPQAQPHRTGVEWPWGSLTSGQPCCAKGECRRQHQLGQQLGHVGHEEVLLRCSEGGCS